MGKKGTVYIIIALVTVAILMGFEYSKPKEINWYPSYVSQHKIPYGTYVLTDVMKTLFSNELEQVTLPPYEFLQGDENAQGTYFFVNNRIEFGEAELDAILNWTAKGNTTFIASEHFEEQLMDTLHLDTENVFAAFGDARKQTHYLVHPELKTENGYVFDRASYASGFIKLDSAQATIIGEVDYDTETDSLQKQHFNIIKRPFGEGTIMLSTFPQAFTNYFILKDNNKDYTAGLLSYFDASPKVYLDQYHKSGKSFYTSPMYIFLNTKEFKWAYYMVLIGTLIYVVFEGKRKQRAIPVVRPLKNQTLAFTRTIADMYYEKREQKSIAEHKIAYFLEYIRSHFYLSTEKQDDDFYKNLASRTHHTFEEVTALFQTLKAIKSSPAISNETLKKLNTLIEKFKRRAHGK